MGRILKFILLVVALGHQAKANSFFENLISQTVAKPIFETPKEYFVTPAIGVGSYSNSLWAQTVDSLSHTNSNFYVIGLDINKYSTHIFIPYKDNDDKIQKTVDSDAFRLQTSFKFFPHVTIDAGFSKVIGFFSGNPDDPKSTVLKYNDLGFKKYSLLFTYMMEDDHRSSLFSPISYGPVETGSSYFFGVELTHNEIMGLRFLNAKLPAPDQQDDPVYSARVLSALGSFGWSQAKMYDNFFWSYAVGVGLGGSYLEKAYENKRSADSALSTTVPLGAQFGWNKNSFTTGLFFLVRSSSVNIDNLRLSSSNGYSGMYLAYLF